MPAMVTPHANTLCGGGPPDVQYYQSCPWVHVTGIIAKLAASQGIVSGIKQEDNGESVKTLNCISTLKRALQFSRLQPF